MFRIVNLIHVVGCILLSLGLCQVECNKPICGANLKMADVVTTDPTWMNQALKLTNEERLKHQVAPLTLNHDLNRISQYWANQLANKYQTMIHTQNTNEGRGTTCGENLYFVSSPKKLVRNGAIPIKAWYIETKNYNFKRGKSGNGKAVGHFTQVVWKKTREMGIAYAKNKNGKTFVVATYAPRGNILGYFTKNVLRPKVVAKPSKVKEALKVAKKPAKPKPKQTKATKKVLKPKVAQKSKKPKVDKKTKTKTVPKTTKKPSKSKKP